MTLLATETGNRKHSLEERGHDLYETPPIAVRALLQVEDIPDSVWEPACGPGSIVRELRAAGRTVMATDLVDYGHPHGVQDFFTFKSCVHPMILTNPPFKDGEKFIAHALHLCPRVTVLMRTNFLAGKRWERGLRDHFARMWQFAPRLPMMNRDGWAGKLNPSSAVDFAWYVFERDHRKRVGNATIDWINPREVS